MLQGLRNVWFGRLNLLWLFSSRCGAILRDYSTSGSRAALLAALLMALYLIILITRAAVNVPFEDEFNFGSIYRAVLDGNIPPLKELLAAHNGHPYILLKLLIISTLNIQIPWSWMMYAQVPLLFGVFMLVYKQWIKSSNRHVLAILAVALIVLSPRQWENLYWAMQMMFAVTLATGVGAIYFLAKYQEEKKLSCLIAALILALIASMSTGAGLFIFLITLIGLISLRLSRTHLSLVAIFGLIGISIFAAAQLFAVESTGGVRQYLSWQLIKHVILMFANTIAFYEQNTNMIALMIGIAIMVLTVYCVWIAIRAFPATIFEASCLLWGLMLIAAVTYARVPLGIFQPDAPRYIPLVAPLIIGSSLILSRMKMQRVLALVVIGLMLGYMQTAVSEWKITPYRKNNLSGSLLSLCNDGIVDRAGLTIMQVRDVQKIFCESPNLNPHIVRRIGVWGPQSTTVNTIPNIQPDGNAGIWIEIFGFQGLGELQVLFSGLPAKITVVQPNLITAAITPDTFTRIGKYDVVIKQISTGIEYPVGMFHVKP